MSPIARTMLATALALALAPGVGHADDGGGRDEEDHEQARHALEEGDVRPLAEILAEVTDRIGGEIVGVEFERQDGRYVYEFKVITPAGRLREMRVDALSAEIMTGQDD